MAYHTVTTSPDAFDSEEFDYIVVGGGTAGLVVASRLAEDRGIRVGVLEAGHDHRGHPQIDIPGHFGSLVGNDEFDWRFTTTGQDGLSGRTLDWPRGKVLGGTSALNFLVWNRGSKHDYDAWEALGNAGWGWDGLLPYFKKSETFAPPTVASQKQFNSTADINFHGASGPVQTSFPPWYSVTHQFWHATAKAVGIPANPSALNGSNVGAWTNIQSVDSVTGKRSYSASAYLHDATVPKENPPSNPNLVILTGAQVLRVVLEVGKGGQLRATGVEYSLGSSKAVLKVKAGREVVLAAGTVQSPQLLELSGIGDRQVLESAGVEPRYHNPNVGRNLQDHLMTALVYEAKPGTYTTEDLAEDAEAKAAAEKQYAEEKDGIYRSSPSSMAYLPLAQFMCRDSFNAFYQSVALGMDSTGLLSQQHQISHRQLLNEEIGHVEFILHHGNSGPAVSEKGKRYVTLHQVHQCPFSRGQIHIRANDVSAKPQIDPGYYSRLPNSSFSPDLETMVAAIQFAAQIPRQLPLKNLIAKRVSPPEEKEDSPMSDNDWRAFVRETTVTDWHPIGTCSMLPEESGGVVDSHLRVYGVEGLRVVDASIIPLHISSHLQATVYAIAEKAADIIKSGI